MALESFGVGADDLTNQLLQILQLAGRPLTTEELVEEMGESRTKVIYRLKKLAEAGRIQRKQTRARGSWIWWFESGERPAARDEMTVLRDIVVPYLRELGFTLIDERLGRVPVRFGRETKYADTVVYVVQKARKRPYLVVETKKPGEALDVQQAESYALMLKAPFFLVTDGETWLWFQTGERIDESTLLRNAPEPPAYAADHLVRFEDLAELKRVIDRLHDIIRNEEGYEPAVSFDEISKLFYAKMQDEWEVEHDRKQRHEFAVLQGESKKYPELTATRVLDLFERAKERYPRVFERTTADIREVKLRHHTILGLVQELQSYALLETNIDVKGSTYELVIKGTFTGRGLGQYFTPREIVEFMVDLVEPDRLDRIIDPACGSGGFLIVAMKHVARNIDELYHNRGLDNPTTEKARFAQENLYGTDLSERMAWVAKMNMVLHGDGHGHLFQHNGLFDTEVTKPISQVADGGGFDIALTNPPFGARISDPRILSAYETGSGKRSQSAEILMLERCLKVLRPGGRVGIVVPDSILANPSDASAREFVRREAIVTPIIKVPEETFFVYGSTAASSLVFLERKEAGREQGPVFMAVARHVGYDRQGNSTEANDLPAILDAYREWRGNPDAEMISEEPLIFAKEIAGGDRLDIVYHEPSELRIAEIIEERFRAAKLTDLIDFVTDSIEPKNFPDQDFGYIGLGDVEAITGEFEVRHVRGRDVRSRCLALRGGDILFSKLRPNLKKAILIPPDVERGICSTEFVVLRPEARANAEFLVRALRSDLVLNQLRSKVTGIGRPRVNVRAIRNLRLPADADIQEKLLSLWQRADRQASKMRTRARRLEKEAKEMLAGGERVALEYVIEGGSPEALAE